jgi:hypothetical protein
MKPTKQPNGRTILMHDDGMPVMVALDTREATSANGRVKARFIAAGEVKGKSVLALMPFTGAKQVEFRMEMN